MKESNEICDYIFKIVLIGDSGVGKTNILSSLVYGEPETSSKPTIGVEFGTKTFKFQNQVIKVQIWDTAGQERYHAITSAYYRGAYGAVIVYDITDKKSLQNTEDIWLINLRKIVIENIPIMFLGNKKDLEINRKIGSEDGKTVAIKNNGAFFETSAKSGENILEAFELFIRTIYDKEKSKMKSQKQKQKKSQDLINQTLESKEKKKKSFCC